ncbi:DUF3375 family protein [uncultured Sphaerochaeta sp.]|uniref:DUF3375 family protein n=1 Tax=uncultured Sphaerochaeta sp. TaxID=886478 RepID=UPI002A0A879C|nr:DUF3375 family protein [uncultured Sphaerochaeta sp.]
MLSDVTFVEQLLQDDSGLFLLSRKNGPKIISFLYTVFKIQNRTNIEQSHLQQLLSGFLQTEDTFIEEDESETSIIELDTTDKARNLILSWSNERNGFLLRYYDEQAIETIELSAGLERIFRFLEEIIDSKKLFIGTESRFAQIMEGFRELDLNTIDNPRARIDELEKQKAKIQEQIDEIERTGKATTFSPQKISERLYNLQQTSKTLLSDFRQLKDNNHAIFSELCHKQIQATESRGQMLGFTLEKSEELENSPQGQSFTSFWNYLCATPEESTIKAKTDALKERLGSQAFDHAFFAHLEDVLIEEGREVIEENRLLSDRIKRVLTRYNSPEYRLIKETLDSIKLLALDNPPYGKEDILFIDGQANIFSSLQRYPIFPIAEGTKKINSYEPPTLSPLDYASLFADVQIDESELLANLEFERNKGKNLCLAEVLLNHPIKEGLAEIVTYLTLLEKQDWAIFDDAKTEIVTYRNNEDGSPVRLIIPKVDINGNDN